MGFRGFEGVEVEEVEALVVDELTGISTPHGSVEACAGT